MRLTLRTLLAYLDDILEPEDRAEISQKLEESEFATQLVHRAQDVMRRIRLGSPQLEGTGVGRDPNSVAEYLDNTLAPEQIQEFERICLESDIHLAEVTSSHRILTMVVGQPVQFEASSRERMYRLMDGAQGTVDHTTAAAADSNKPSQLAEKADRQAAPADKPVG